MSGTAVRPADSFHPHWDGKKCELSPPGRGALPSILVIGVHKGGSTVRAMWCACAWACMVVIVVVVVVLIVVVLFWCCFHYAFEGILRGSGSGLGGLVGARAFSRAFL